eukprot:CFRG7235T1
MLAVFTSPCALLGVSSSQKLVVQRAMRKVSLCTHPDKFRTLYEKERATVLFNRVTSAKSQISDNSKAAKRYRMKPSCWWEEKQIMNEVWNIFRSFVLGLPDIVMYYMDTGELPLNSFIFAVVYLLAVIMLFRTHSILSVIRALVFRPLPTFVLYIVNPFVRVWLIGKEVLLHLGVGMDTDSTTGCGSSGCGGDDNKSGVHKSPVEDGRDVCCDASDTDIPTSAVAPSEGYDNSTVTGMGYFLIGMLKQRPPERETDYRNWGVHVMQFDFLLHFTKNLLPLMMVTVTGQVYSGLVAALITSQFIRMLPTMTYEHMHVAVFLFGLCHTFLGLGIHEIEGKAGDNIGDKVLDLKWALGIEDTASLLFLAIQGARFHNLTSLGNDPLFTISFAGGLAARLALFDLVPYSAQEYLESLPFSSVFPFRINENRPSMTQFSSTIGGCAGGPFRLILGSEPLSIVADLTFRVLFIALAGMYMFQWHLLMVKKTKNDSSVPGNSTTVFRSMLCGVGMILSFVLARYSFNGVNSEYAAFLFMGLQSILLESFLRLYFVRGKLERLITWICFILH